MSSGPYVYGELAQLQDQDRNVSHAQGLSKATSGVFCEILPVTLESNQVVLLRRPTDCQALSWLVMCQPERHPNETVLQHVVAFFGEVFEPHASIVYSTSWRYECETGRLVLTYLIVLPQRAWMRQWAATERIHFEYVGAIQKIQGDNLYPPERMKIDYVLAHALDCFWQSTLRTIWQSSIGHLAIKKVDHFSLRKR